MLATCYHGGYAEEIVFADLEVVEIPAAMDFESAAAFYIASNTVAVFPAEARARCSPESRCS